MRYAVVFDYNGVIVDDEEVHELAFSSVLRSLGIKLTPSLYENCCVGRTDHDGFIKLRAAFVNEFNGTSIIKLVKAKEHAYESFVELKNILYPDVVDVIHQLGKSFRLAVVTSSSRDELLSVLERFDIKRSFSCLVTADDIVNGKPNPEGYLKSLELLRLPTNRVIAIEDSPSGIQAAKAAGLLCIAVQHTTSESKLVAADRIVGKIGDINTSLVTNLLLQSKSSRNGSCHRTTAT